jgi:hypothetical protein
MSNGFVIPRPDWCEIAAWAYSQGMSPVDHEAALWVLLIALIGLEIFVASEMWQAFRTKKWRRTLFLPFAFTGYFASKDGRYWYRASLFLGTIDLLVCGVMIWALLIDLFRTDG